MSDTELCREVYREVYREMFRAMTAKDATVLQGLTVRGATAQNDANATAKAVSDRLNGPGLNK